MNQQTILAARARDSFIRHQNINTPVKLIVSKGKKAGFKDIKPQHVWSMRSRMKKERENGLSGQSNSLSGQKPNGSFNGSLSRKPNDSFNGSFNSSFQEQQDRELYTLLLAVAAELGLPQAIARLEEERRRIKEMVLLTRPANSSNG